MSKSRSRDPVPTDTGLRPDELVIAVKNFGQPADEIEMMRPIRILLLAGLCVLTSAFPQSVRPLGAQIRVGTPAVVSVSPSGEPSTGGLSYLPVAGPNADALVFESGATNLVVGDTNGRNDVFFRDPATKKLRRASVTTQGTQGDHDSAAPSISRVLPDGFFAIAFQSRAGNLGSIPNPTERPNIYVRLPTLGITEIVSPAHGFALSEGESYAPSVAVVVDSAGNKKVLVAFSSTSEDLVPNDRDDDTADIFVATVNVPPTNTYAPASFSSVQRITRAAVPEQELDGSSAYAQLSADGRYVLFGCRARNLLSPPIENANYDLQIYRHDLHTGETILVSRDGMGTPGNHESLYPALSYTGRFISYFTFATNIVGNATSRPFFPFVVRYDVLDGTTQQVNLAADGTTSGLGQLLALGISSNGRLITFGDASDALVPNDTNGQGDVFVKDMESGAIARLSVGKNGVQSNGYSSNPTLTATTLNGQSFAVAFESLASSLGTTPAVSGLGDLFETNFVVDVPTLATTTRLETPPDVQIRGKRLGLGTQRFRLVTSAATSRQSLRYEFEITRTTPRNGKPRVDRTKVIDRRNAITVGRTAGTYQIRTRARVVDGTTGRTIAATPYSPNQTFTLRR